MPRPKEFLERKRKFNLLQFMNNNQLKKLKNTLFLVCIVLAIQNGCNILENQSLRKELEAANKILVEHNLKNP